MKTAEEYALEEWTDGDGGYSPYEIAKMAFDAGLAEGKSIWKKPDERPEFGESVVYVFANGCPMQTTFTNEDDWPGRTAWCRASDFLKTLPDWAKEVGE